MSLSNTEIRYYDSTVLRLPADKRKEYHEQVDRLISALTKRVHEQSDIKITKVVKAGSFAKYTILRETNEDPVDVDVVFYISGRNVDQVGLASLTQLIYDTDQVVPQQIGGRLRDPAKGGDRYFVVGEATHIGAGAVILQDVTIGRQVVIAAGTSHPPQRG